VQRHLLAHRTTARGELDAARLSLARQAGSRNMARLAHRLGYARSVRYAVPFAAGKAAPVTVARKVPLLTRAVLPARRGRCETNQS
jgi:hypothetical protein